MITKLSNEPIKRTGGIIQNGMLEQIRAVFQQDPQLAMELAFSYIELVLLDDGISSDNPMIPMLMKSMEPIVESNKEKYDQKVERSQDKARIDKKLDEIAELYNKGVLQKDIARMIGVSTGEISKRLTLIRNKYGDSIFLKEKEEVSKNLESFQKNGNISKKMETISNGMETFPKK